MNIKKVLVIGISFVLVAILGIVGYFYFNFYRPFMAPNREPSRNIISEIKELNNQVRGNESADSEPENRVEGNVENVGPLTYPDYFSVSIYAENLNKVRVLKFDPNGNLLASITDSGRVVVLIENESGDVSDKIILSGLNQPHGIALKCEGQLLTNGDCDLYVAETNEVNLYAYNMTDLTADYSESLFELPAGAGHYTRTVEIFNYQGGPKLFTSVGSSCNVCNESEEYRATVLISDLNGENLRIFSDGLRNAVFLTQRPGTEEIWVTEMGRDRLGDNTPPDEINVLQDGGFYGWPYCYGDKTQDTTFDDSEAIARRCQNSIGTQINIQAHSAPLGLEFIPGSWPQNYQSDLLVAYHGSWNRTVPTGYKIVRMVLDENGNYQETEDFITGWFAENGEVLGRPVDVAIYNDDLYVSDDKLGVIYRFSLSE